MTIVPLTKVSLVGILDDKEKVLEAAQSFGMLHLIPLSSAQKELEAVPAGLGRESSEALRWLLECPVQRRPVTEQDDFDLEEVVSEALSNRKTLKDCRDRLEQLARRIRDVEPWGEFSFSELAEIGDNRLWFYVVPAGKLKQVDPAGKVMEIVHRDKYRAYVGLLAPEEPPAGVMPVPRVHVGALSLSQLRRRYERAAVELEELELERQLLTKWRFLLAQNLAAARDQSRRSRAALETADSDRLFVMQAWARKDQRDEIHHLADTLGLAALFDDVSGEDKPPTLLENARPMEGGEDLVEFYQTPGYRDWDPSAIVYVSFILFFGMLMTDAGYGLLLLLLLFLFPARAAHVPHVRLAHDLDNGLRRCHGQLFRHRAAARQPSRSSEGDEPEGRRHHDENHADDRRGSHRSRQSDARHARNKSERPLSAPGLVSCRARRARNLPGSGDGSGHSGFGGGCRGSAHGRFLRQ